MSEKSNKISLPYATYPAFINFINKLRETGVPARIDKSAFGNASGSLVYSVLASLKALKLIDENGVPSNRFNNFVTATDEERGSLLQQIVMSGYPTLFQDGFDLTNITAGQFNDHIRQEFNVAGSTIDKIASFFLAASKAAGISVSHFLENRTPIVSATSSKKNPRQRKKADDGNDELPSPPLPKPAVISEKALEYRLVDLMTDAVDNPEIMKAIIQVITFLKTKDVTKSTQIATEFDGKEYE